MIFKKFTLFLVCGITAAMFLPMLAFASTLRLSPSSGSYSIGSAISLNVSVSSPDQAMNAASGVISFPPDKLTVTSISKGGSIFSLWAQEPSFSNGAGTVNFEGIVLNPGFTGAIGKILTVNFRVKAAGDAAITFSSGSILANDGLGTNILTALSGAQLNLKEAVPEPAAPRPSPKPVTPKPSVPSIDTTKPSSFEIKEITRDDLTDPVGRFIFLAVDEQSGIDHYEILIDNGDPIVWRDDGAHQYKTPALGPGRHLLIAKVLDKEGNFLSSSADFIVEGLASPKILEYPKELHADESFAMSGVTLPHVQVTVWIGQNENDQTSQSVESDSDGKFALHSEKKLSVGTYKFWAQISDPRGARSPLTDKLIFAVTPPPLAEVTASAMNYLTVLIPFAALLLLLIGLLFYGWHKLMLLKKHLRKEVDEAESALHRAYNFLKDDVEEQIKMLKRASLSRKLTAEESKVVKQLKKDLDDAEKFVLKEIKDIKKEVE